MKKILSILSLAIALPLFAGDIVIYPFGIATNNLVKSTTCPGDTRWRATYVKTPSQGWGWSPDTNGNTLFTATITNRTDTHVSFFGSQSDSGCNASSVQISNPPPSIKYRFTVYGTNNPPASTNDLPLVLHNFLP